MKFSIVCPVYNSERYLDESIVSIVNQSFLNWELVLIDDGSTDKSGSICDKYALSDKRIKVIHTANRGPFEARKTGLRHISGDYILFLDSDDYYCLDALKVLNDKINKQERPDLLVFQFISQKSTGEEHVNGRFFNGETKDLLSLKKALILNKTNNLVSKCFNSDVVHKSFKSFSQVNSIIEEDLLMNIVLFDQVKNFTYVDSPLYYYRFVSSSTMNMSIDPKTFIDKKINTKSTDFILKYAKKWGLYEETYLEIYKNKISRVIDIFNNIIYLHGWKVAKSVLKGRDLFSLINGEAHKYITLVDIPSWMKKEGNLIYKKKYTRLYFLCLLLKIRYVFKQRVNRD